MKLIENILSSNKKIAITLVCIVVISSIPLFINKETSWGHDLIFHLSRISAIEECIETKESCSYIYSGYLNGYGYGNPLFYPDIFLYIPAFFMNLGLSLLTSYKIFLVLLNFATVGIMYYSVKMISQNKKAALFSSIFYSLSSYRLVDLYTRSSIGEGLAFIFVPIIIWGIYEIIYRDYKKNYILIIGMSGLIFSHIITTYIIGIFIFIICLINIKKFLLEKKRIVSLLISTIITLMITSVFLAPMIEQLLSTNFFLGQANPIILSERTIPFCALFLEFAYHYYFNIWVPPGIGLGFIVLIILYFKRYKESDSFVKICFVCGTLFLLFSTRIFPWDFFQSVLGPIQFPWRLYFLTTLLLSVGGGIFLAKFPRNKYVSIVLLTFIVPVISVGASTVIEYKLDELPDLKKYTVSSGVKEYTASYGEYLPEKFALNYDKDRGEVIDSKYPLVFNFNKKGSNINIYFKENDNKNNELELPLIYYKGYQAIINEKKLEVFETENGLVGIKLRNYSSGMISVGYGGTTIQKATKIISLATIALYFSYLIIKKRYFIQ